MRIPHPSTGIRAGPTPPQTPQRGEPDLAVKIAFLRDPASYEDGTVQVEAVETHMSWLFLTGQLAYKLKKPFQRGLIDYTTPAARRRSCMGELRLNRRLAPDVYLDVLPLTLDSGGRLALGGRGRRVDWLVRMRRMPALLSLEHRIREHSVTQEDARRIVGKLAPFFAAAPRARWGRAGYRRRLVSAINLASGEIVRPEFDLDPARIESVERLSSDLRHFVATRLDLLDARVSNGWIVEGHGDLRPEHIYLTYPPTVMDCIEFDRNLRLRDPIDELSFLSMESDRLGEPRLDGWLFDAWRELARDDVPRPLIQFYKAYSALVRAQIAIWHLEGPGAGPRQKWIERTDDYLHRAHGYLAIV